VESSFALFSVIEKASRAAAGTAAPPLSNVCTATPARDAVAAPSAEVAYAGNAAVPTSPLAAATTTTFAQIERSRRFCERSSIEDRDANGAQAGRTLLRRREVGADGSLPTARNESSRTPWDAATRRLPCRTDADTRLDARRSSVWGGVNSISRRSNACLSRRDEKASTAAVWFERLSVGSDRGRPPGSTASCDREKSPADVLERATQCLSPGGMRTDQVIQSSQWEYPVMVCARYQLVTFCV